MALNTEPEHPLFATVIYYGNLVTDEQDLAKIKWPVLGIFGDQDQSIPIDDVKRFEQALNTTAIPNEIHIYEGVGHAFANHLFFYDHPYYNIFLEHQYHSSVTLILGLELPSMYNSFLDSISGSS